MFINNSISLYLKLKFDDKLSTTLIKVQFKINHFFKFNIINYYIWIKQMKTILNYI